MHRLLLVFLLVFFSSLFAPQAYACKRCTSCGETWTGFADCGPGNCQIACFHAAPSCNTAEAYVPGFFLAREGERLTVGGIIPGSQASQAGLRLGDELIAVNGQLTEGAAIPAVWLKLRSYYPGTVHVKLRRASVERETTLELQNLRELLEAAWATSESVMQPQKLLASGPPSRSHMPPAFLAGIDVRITGGRVYIDRVLRGSPAEQLGLRSDLEILRINGAEAASLAPGDILRTFTANEAGLVRLHLSVGGQVQEVNLPLEGLSRIVRRLTEAPTATLAEAH